MGKIGESEILFTREACPDCGGEGIYVKTLKEEIAAGKVGPQCLTGLPEVGMVMDMLKTAVLTVPQIITLNDFCLKCGRKYVVAIIRTTIPKPQMQGQPMQIPRKPGNGGSGDLPGFMQRGGKF